MAAYYSPNVVEDVHSLNNRMFMNHPSINCEAKMTSKFNLFRNIFSPKQGTPAGIYHYQSPPDDPRNYRLHLRVEANGDGILIVNASTVLHLNQTATDYAYFMVHNISPDRVAHHMSARYQIDTENARQDYLELSDRIRALIEMPDLDPVTFLDFDRRQPFSGRLSAPLRLDCALTYRLPTSEPAESAPIDRVDRELNTDEWKSILDKAWIAGIPHVIFTGGEPTLRDDLVDLIAHAEELGQVTGLLTEGLLFSERSRLDELLQAGLDHLMLILHPENEESWKAVENVMIEDLSVIVHLTITPQNSDRTEEILQRLLSLDVQKISLSAIDPSLAEALLVTRDRCAALGLELVWNIPVPYSSFHPVALEEEDASIQGAGKAWLYVEPDGDIRPTQGDAKILGNILTDRWEDIWSSEA
jgi:organic radical activating enzyme